MHDSRGIHVAVARQLWQSPFMRKPSPKAPLTADWLTSKQTCHLLKTSSCELMHLRESGHLRFTKKGNAFLYHRADVQRIIKGL
jgi:hypothetical protein